MSMLLQKWLVAFNRRIVLPTLDLLMLLEKCSVIKSLNFLLFVLRLTTSFLSAKTFIKRNGSSPESCM